MARRDLDVLLGCNISTALYALNVDVPVVYFSDTTAQLINETYPEYSRRCRSYKTACDDVERGALAVTWASVFATERARSSAIGYYGVPPHHAFTVPMGANVVPDGSSRIGHLIVPPTRDSLQLCIVASDPVRKRLDLALDVTRGLRSKGWNARLTYVGPPFPPAERAPFVTCLGQLRLSNPNNRRTYRQLLQETHVMLLPSRGEAFGIAPCEAAHFARPSVVSEAGGLPEVVLHGRTGLVLPMNAKAVDYITAIDELARSPSRYATMCRAARQRAINMLSWERWAERIGEILAMAARSRGETGAAGRPVREG